MVTRQRAVDRGTARGRQLIRTIGAELRLARTRLGLSIAAVAGEIGVSPAELSRIELAQAEWVSVVTLARASAVVGLDLAARAYPGGRPIREARHAALLNRLRGRLHLSLRWSVEVPLPNAGDQRAWDAMIRGADWRYGVECELNPIDGQAALRRIALKKRDGGVDDVILLVPDTRQGRLFKREYEELIRADYPISAGVALRRLADGHNPGGSALVTL